ncbi:MAG TPA: hypothetical protein VFX38_02585 [Gammaproteobacteria bacterium]|nr:hypothetical protein [Gammaproteobacteria bacterium]
MGRLRAAGGLAITAETQSAFHSLLARLGAEGKVEVEYERLRRRLIVYFRLSFPVQAETLADTALDRLARRLDEGVAVENVAAYTLGIARLLVLEAQAQALREQKAVRLETAASQDDDAEEDGEDEELERQRTAAALETCLKSLNTAGAELILSYYRADGSDRIRVRQKLAAGLGVSVHALRNRALRLRAALEDCVRRRLQVAGVTE